MLMKAIHLKQVSFVWMQVRDAAAMLANVSSRAEAVMDARSIGRFHGKEPEPRPGLRGGHLPGNILTEKKEWVQVLEKLDRRHQQPGGLSFS